MYPLYHHSRFSTHHLSQQDNLHFDVCISSLQSTSCFPDPCMIASISKLILSSYMCQGVSLTPVPVRPHENQFTLRLAGIYSSKVPESQPPYLQRSDSADLVDSAGLRTPYLNQVLQALSQTPVHPPTQYHALSTFANRTSLITL